jgi:hypothetical protein
MESRRLQNQATVINPVKLTPQIMKVITAIDGAVLINSGSTCYAVGVILDGLASPKGTPARGARYNSAIRYVESSEYACMAIVVSEDGSVDLLPDLMPQISRSLIIDKIAKLRELKVDAYFDHRKFNQTMSWLSKHRFYLTPEMCSEINELRREVETVRNQQIEPTAVRLLYQDFTPQPDMNESYFLED